MTTCAIIVTDTGPLKTLAYARRLDLFLKPGLPVYITDMVIEELRAGSQYLGNQLALDFIKDQVGVSGGLLKKIDTGVPQNAETLRSLRVDPGEQSLKIVLEDYYSTHPNDYALLLFEDNGIAKKTFVLPENVSLLTTRPFLQELERRKIIASAEDVLKAAEMASLAACDERKLLSRKKEHAAPPRNDPSVKWF
ncbi:hypothetical protein [Thiomonas sp. FB-Cd]|uniref:hypothetical protein n=1 Tax=Thiomonas sp. FB-Cd TaxID=1158292 RepID=UPI0004DFBED8|nr:hypothetical protein [Thiomonas sp. FB-Cd]